jgi:ADP-ribosylglycohydrolase
MTNSQRFEGCIIGGAIGDAYGSAFENLSETTNDNDFYPFGKPEPIIPEWQITDDTQLTLATCESITEHNSLQIEQLAQKFSQYYKHGKITGIGSSTLQALKAIDVGSHWRFSGRTGEFAAGNGAAMRIAPLAFIKNISREQIRNACIITHNNDEAYVGALAVVITIQSILNKTWTGKENLLELIIDTIPDTRVRDRFIKINTLNKLDTIAKLGNDGYVVNSIPLAITYASKVHELGIENMYKQLIQIGGDTDTNCSIAGQLAGTLLGIDSFPKHLIDKLKQLKDYNWIENTILKARFFIK